MTSPIERRALITRAISGLGKATALAFAKAGIDVALVSTSSHRVSDFDAQCWGYLEFLRVLFGCNHTHCC